MDNVKHKIQDIANDDLAFISCFLSKIQATALSVYSYLDNTIESNERTSNALYMLNVIKDLTNMADKSLTETADKLYAVCGETKEKLKQEG